VKSLHWETACFIRHEGRLSKKLRKRLLDLGLNTEEGTFARCHPMWRKYEDEIAWSIYARAADGQKVYVYSHWTMSQCCRASRIDLSFDGSDHCCACPADDGRMGDRSGKAVPG